MSDDSGMNALTGSPGERAAACVAAGCDVALPCDGVFEHNLDVARLVPDMSPLAIERLDRAMATIAPRRNRTTRPGLPRSASVSGSSLPGVSVSVGAGASVTTTSPADAASVAPDRCA